MTKIRYSALAVIGLTFACLAADDHPAKQPRKARHKAPKAVAPLAIEKIQAVGPPQVPAPPAPLMLKVETLQDVSKEKLELHKQIAISLSQAQLLPAHRAAHFQWLVNDGRFRVNGWHGFIRQTVDVPGGVLVKLQITPVVESNMGAHTTIFDYTFETYRVLADGSIEFVEGFDPPNAKGPGFYAM